MKRNIEIDIAKLIAMILVVLGHVITERYEYVCSDFENMHYLLLPLKQFIYTFHMPLFMFLSGFLFGKSNLKDWNVFVLNKFKRLMGPYFVFGLLLLYPICIIVGDYSFSVRDMCSTVFLGVNFKHMWFLEALFIIFIMFYLIRKYIVKYPIVFTFVFVLINFTPSYCPIYFFLPAVATYLLYFHIGFLCGIKDLIKYMIDCLKNKWFVLFLLMIVCFCINRVFVEEKMVSSMMNRLNAFIGIIMIMGLSTNLKKIYISNPIFCALTKNSMGIYLFHPIFIYLIVYLFEKMGIKMPYLLCMAVFFFFSLVLSFVTTSFLRKNNKLSIIIGE